MLVNGLKGSRDLLASDELATNDGILAKVDVFKVGKDEGIRGVSLDGFARALPQVLKPYGLDGYRIESHRVAADDKAGRAEFHRALVENEKSSRDLIVPLFLQGVLTGDLEGMVGHFAPLGAYDAKTGRVLMLDPDRKWYEPYWVSEDDLWSAMADKADTVKSGGWIWIRPPELLAKPPAIKTSESLPKKK